MAGQIVLKNGDRITGTIKGVWDDSITIEPDYAGELAVDIGAVEYFETDREFAVSLTDGREGTATFPGADDDGNQLVALDEETTALALSELEEVQPPAVWFEWGGRLRFDAAINKGNTDSENTRFFADGMLRFGDHRHLADLTLSREEQDGVTTKEQDLARYNYNWLFNDSWFFAAGLSYERDPIRELDHRYVAYTGVGRDIWNDARRLLNFTFGLGYSTEEIAMVSEDNAVAIWRLRFRHAFFADKLDTFHNHEITSNISGRTNTFIKTSTGLTYDINDKIFASISVDYDYESKPAAGAEQEDLALLVGIGIDFN